MLLLVIRSFSDNVTLDARTRIIFSSVVGSSPVTLERIAWYCANRMRGNMFFLKCRDFCLLAVCLFACLFKKVLQDCYYQVAEMFLGPDLQLM